MVQNPNFSDGLDGIGTTVATNTTVPPAPKNWLEALFSGLLSWISGTQNHQASADPSTGPQFVSGARPRDLLDNVQRTPTPSRIIPPTTEPQPPISSFFNNLGQYELGPNGAPPPSTPTIGPWIGSENNFRVMPNGNTPPPYVPPPAPPTIENPSFDPVRAEIVRNIQYQPGTQASPQSPQQIAAFNAYFPALQATEARERAIRDGTALNASGQPIIPADVMAQINAIRAAERALELAVIAQGKTSEAANTVALVPNQSANDSLGEARFRADNAVEGARRTLATLTTQFANDDRTRGHTPTSYIAAALRNDSGYAGSYQSLLATSTQLGEAYKNAPRTGTTNTPSSISHQSSPSELAALQNYAIKFARAHNSRLGMNSVPEKCDDPAAVANHPKYKDLAKAVGETHIAEERVEQAIIRRSITQKTEAWHKADKEANKKRDELLAPLQRELTGLRETNEAQARLGDARGALNGASPDAAGQASLAQGHASAAYTALGGRDRQAALESVINRITVDPTVNLRDPNLQPPLSQNERTIAEHHSALLHDYRTQMTPLGQNVARLWQERGALQTELANRQQQHGALIGEGVITPAMFRGYQQALIAAEKREKAALADFNKDLPDILRNQNLAQNIPPQARDAATAALGAAPPGAGWNAIGATAAAPANPRNPAREMLQVSEPPVEQERQQTAHL